MPKLWMSGVGTVCAIAHYRAAFCTLISVFLFVFSLSCVFCWIISKSRILMKCLLYEVLQGEFSFPLLDYKQCHVRFEKRSFFAPHVICFFRQLSNMANFEKSFCLLNATKMIKSILSSAPLTVGKFSCLETINSFYFL